jgi:hypothetical protein
MNRHMTFVFKQCTQHWYSNNKNKWMTSMSMSLWKSNFTQLLLSNCDPWSGDVNHLNNPMKCL